MTGPGVVDVLLELVDSFLSGADRSVRLASTIEGVLLSAFHDAEWWDDVVTALSLYSPGNGSSYLDQKGMASVLAEWRPHLAAERPQPGGRAP